MRRYIACLLTLGATCAFTQQLSAQIQLPAPKSYTQPASGQPAKPRVDPASPTLRKLSVPASQTRSIATVLGLRYRDVPGVQISADVRNQHLVVLAPESAQKRIAEDVNKFLAAGGVRKSESAAKGPFSFQLRNLNWRQFENLVQVADGRKTPVTANHNNQAVTYQLTGAPLRGTTVTVDRRQNIVKIDAPDTIMPGWKRFVGLVDEAPAKPGRQLEVVRLDGTEPAPIQKAYRLLKQLRPAAAPVKTQKRQPLFRTAAFQQQADDTGTPPADEAAEGAEDAGAGGAIGDAQIQFVPELGQVIIKGTPQEIARIKEVIAEIQKANEVTRPEIAVLPLEHADCNAVATLLQQLYEDVLSARQGDVSITSLDVPNALLLIGRKEAIESLRDLVSKIDVPVAEANRLRVFRLQNASATDAEEAIRNFVAEGEADGARPGLGLRIRLYSDFRTNSLIVNAAPRDMDEITRLINELDVQDTTITNEIKVIQLNNASAEVLQETLQTAIDGGDGGNDNVTPPSAGLSIVAVDQNGNRVINSGILVGATVTADSGANALVVRAPSSSMPLLEELIRQLDRSPGIDSLVKVFTVENGDATQLATSLTDLFGDDAATSGTTIGAGNASGLPSATASSESTLVPLRFSVDARTNSIIVSGSATDLEVVESILLRLDSEGFAERITEVIWLRHGLAASISTAVTNYVTERQQSQNNINQYQAGLGPYDLVDRDLIAIAETDSNSLLLSVSPRLYEDVRRLIDQLDRQRPMIMIKVLMAEVALDDTFEIGGELGLQDSLVFNRGLAVADVPGGAVAAGNPGFNFNNAGVPNVNNFRSGNVGATGVSTFGLGQVSDVTAYGGFVLNAASESVSLLMRTLHEAGRLQVLTRPQLTTLDNTESLVQVGSRIARVTGFNTTNIGNVILETADIDVGLILRITPRVGSDGLITMVIDLTRSARDPNNGTAIPDGNGNVVIIDDILQTIAQSTLTAYSGQTVVFGGLIQKSRTNVSRRIPGLADIPLIGNAFKFDTEQESRSELLVVMTPMLINGEQDLEYIKQVESSRMSWCLADVVEAHGDVGLSGGYGLWGPAVGNTIYPDLQPTVEREVVVSDQAIPHPQPTTLPAVPQPTEEAPRTPDSGYTEMATELIPTTSPVVVEEPATGVAPLGPDPEFGDVPAGVIEDVAPVPSLNDGAKASRKGRISPVSWLKSKRDNGVAVASKPFRLGSTTKPANAEPKASGTRDLSNKTLDEILAPKAEPKKKPARGLLPSISPLSWIR